MCARLFLVSALLSLGGFLHAATISGTVRDASGALIPKASVVISSPSLPAPVSVISDQQGAFSTPDLPPGHYEITAAHTGFEAAKQSVDLNTDPLVVSLKLSLAVQHQEVTVKGNRANYANNDPVYTALRNVGVGRSFALKPNATLAIDVASFQFRQGVITFLEPVNGIVTGAVFTGDGQLTLTPLMAIDKSELRRRTNSEIFQEDFNRVVFRLSRRYSRFLLALADSATATPPEASRALEDWRGEVRHRREDATSMLESIVNGEGMDNVDADLLAGVYNPNHPGMFSAYVHGAKHKDLRFFLRERGGAIPQIGSPEEVGLMNFAPESFDNGILYLAHIKSEIENSSASSLEDRRFVSAKQFKIETVIGRNMHLTAIATIDIESLIPGERVVKFNLLPRLRVSRVSGYGGKDLYFIQESRNTDASLYVILPEACELRKTYSITVEYSGDRVISSAGEGSFYVRARECWYPTPNEFYEHSLFDLTFRVPKRMVLVSVGQLKSSSVEDDFAVTHWVTPGPVPVAGFNYGDYKETQLTDGQTHTTLTGFYLEQLPDYLRNAAFPEQAQVAVQSLAPAAMTKHALQIARTEVQLCNHFFGPSGFDSLSVTEQPDFAFGQSWPNLIYLPISAYTDSTQRYLLFGQINTKFTDFVQEVTPHEVAHQWWGHAVTWASYHDQWLSEGFAEFSASLFVLYGHGPNHESDYRHFWDQLRKEILQAQNFGAPNDAGPVWLGLRLVSPRQQYAYRNVVYPKGAYVLGMLRSLMYDELGDARFIKMMKDFVSNNRNGLASTESFKAVAEKYMPKQIDFRHNGKLDWFFDEWVYGTEVPKYTFTSELTALPNGHSRVRMSLTQSEVDANFTMAVPVFAQTKEGRMIRFAQIPITGNTTRTVEAEIPAHPKAVELDPFHEILQR